MCSGLFNSGWISGAFLGLILSGILVEKIGFELASSCFGLTLLLSLIIYLLFS